MIALARLRLAWAALALLAALVAPAQADLVISGSARYVDREFSFDSGFTGVEPELPVRFATVRVIEAASGAILAVSATDASGDFSIPIVGSGQMDVIVRVVARSEAFGAAVRVTNVANQVYSMATPTFAGWDLSTDLDIGTLVSPKVFAAGRFGNPFNLLDQFVVGVGAAQAIGAPSIPQDLQMTWPAGPVSFSSGTESSIAADDGYDDLVALHELAHLLYHLFVDEDQQGGSHSFGESDQDPRLSFTEGWATAFAALARDLAGFDDSGFYLDASGTGATGPASIQLRLRLEDGSPFIGSTEGEANEGAVACTLWDLVDGAETRGPVPGGDDDPVDGSFEFEGGLDGAQLLWRALEGTVAAAQDATVLDLWHGLFAPSDPGHGAELVEVVTAWKLGFAADAAEPDDGLAAARLLDVGGGWSVTRTLYRPPPGAYAPGDGDGDFHRFTLSQGQGFEVSTRYPGGNPDAGTFVDPLLRVRRPDGSLFGQDDDSGVGRNALVAGIADADGEWYAEVSTQHPFRRAGSYEVRVDLAGSDCNGNGIPDEQDVLAGTSLDLDGDGGPDECQPLSADLGSLPLLFGGTQTLSLDAGAAHAGQLYWILGSTTGTRPGIAVDGVLLPLNVDAYTGFTLANPGFAPLIGGLGSLDAEGKGTAQFALPSGVSLSLVGTVVNHAFFVVGGSQSLVFASNPIPITFTLF
ncbi:hypothetical protein [Engelhardtia mirabilis]|uniref:Uncharacterized protein n=1 Tax=Engelhardtia mirabilis TaxID=2528011 RepID=A0A518BNZ2_9BACT|nr:hypothetical protein Pla133_37940 [Planctomycetes bacterium Pla133]QDV03018.1 hypothetical protein Pla86_37930 [Planctomycetes bacterium Pla86]